MLTPAQQEQKRQADQAAGGRQQEFEERQRQFNINQSDWQAQQKQQAEEAWNKILAGLVPYGATPASQQSAGGPGLTSTQPQMPSGNGAQPAPQDDVLKKLFPDYQQLFSAGPQGQTGSQVNGAPQVAQSTTPGSRMAGPNPGAPAMPTVFSLMKSGQQVPFNLPQAEPTMKLRLPKEMTGMAMDQDLEIPTKGGAPLLEAINKAKAEPKKPLEEHLLESRLRAKGFNGSVEDAVKNNPALLNQIDNDMKGEQAAAKRDPLMQQIHEEQLANLRSKQDRDLDAEANTEAEAVRKGIKPVSAVAKELRVRTDRILSQDPNYRPPLEPRAQEAHDAAGTQLDVIDSALRQLEENKPKHPDMPGFLTGPYAAYRAWGGGGKWAPYFSKSEISSLMQVGNLFSKMGSRSYRIFERAMVHTPNNMTDSWSGLHGKLSTMRDYMQNLYDRSGKRFKFGGMPDELDSTGDEAVNVATNPTGGKNYKEPTTPKGELDLSQFERKR